MIGIISEYYKQKGFDKLYVNINKEPRRVATLRAANGYMTSMSYAKYVYTSYWRCEIPKGEQIDHINGDKLDDRIENLQKVSQRYNNLKDRLGKEMVERICPVCKCVFLFPKRNLAFHRDPCCCKRCGGIKSHWNNKYNYRS